MEKKMFNELLKSVHQAKAIMKGGNETRESL